MRSPVQVWSAAPLKNTPLRVCFFNVCKVFCTHLHNFFEIVRGACRLRSMPFLASNPSSSLAVSSSLNIVCSRRKRRVFLMCAKFFAHICTISSKLCVEPVVCARRSRILRALIAFSCRQQLYGLFCHRRLSAAVLFVWFFNFIISWIIF